MTSYNSYNSYWNGSSDSRCFVATARRRFPSQLVNYVGVFCHASAHILSACREGC